MTLDIIDGFARAVQILWMVGYVFHNVAWLRGSSFDGLADAIYYELRPFFPVALVADFVIDSVAGEPLGWTRIAGNALWLFIWWTSRHDTDDRWKRRRKKVADKVAEVGGRLTVVPAGAQA